jgi:translation initiation factor 5B
MVGLFIVLAMALGVGGTAVVSDSARPGDALFRIDRAVENARLSFTRDENKNELRIRFAEERLKEVKEIKAETGVETESEDSDDSSKEEEESEEEIKIGLEAALNLITDVTSSGEEEDPRLIALATALSAYMNALPEGARVEISDDKFRIKFDQGPEKIEIKEQGDNKTKIDVRTEEGRFKIEVKDGQIEIKTKTEDEDEDEGDDDSKDELEAEAKIFSDKTVVEVEIKDQKTTFSSSATTEAAIVAAIVARFPELTSAEVSAVLEIEIEDEDDGDENDDEENDEDEADEEDEDEEDEDESDEDESESNSGSGSR